MATHPDQHVFTQIKENFERGAVQAIEDHETWYDWAAVKRIADHLDTLLTDAGLGPGSPIGLVARNRMPHISVLYALLATGRTTVMIYSAQSPEALAQEFKTLKLPAVVADTEDWQAVTIAACTAAGTLGLKPTTDPDDPVQVIVEGNARAPGQRQASPDTAIEMLSSGTTGAPKRIPISWRTLRMTCEDAALNFQETGLGFGGSAPAPLVQPAPLANIGGLYAAVPAGLKGWPLALLEKFKVDAWLRAVKRVRPQVSWLAPAAIKAVWDADVPPEDLSSLIGLRTGSAALNPELQDAFEGRYGLSILLAYGATEFCGVIAIWTLADHEVFAKPKRGSAGRARPGVDLRVRDVETGDLLPPGGIGILEMQVDRISPDWIVSTDLASIDADGFLFLHGRSDDAINRGGFKILPNTVTDAICKHPDVSDAAVVGVADDRLGAIPVAAVALREGRALQASALKDFLRDHLVAYQIPAQIRILDQLPRNQSLKVDRKAVQALFEEH